MAERAKKHRILLVVKHPIGGIRTFFRYVYSTFDAEKYEFVLLAPPLKETELLLTDLAQLNLTFMPTAKGLSDGGLFFEVIKLVRRTPPFDLIHAHGFTAGACSAPVARMRKIPHLITLHETLSEEHFAGAASWIKKLGLAFLFSLSDAIQCVSHDARDNLIRSLGMPQWFENKVHVIKHGIDANRFLHSEIRDLKRELCLQENAFTIGFLGRYMPEKGFGLLVDALAAIKDKEKPSRQVVLLSFGQEDGYYREEKQNVDKKGLTEWVYFMPFVPNVASTLKGLDVVVMPSLREACGLLAMETLVAGVPLIGSNCVGLREVLRDTPARIVPSRDSVALTEALLMEMKNPTTVKAQEFTIEAAARFEVKNRAAEIEKLMVKFLER